MLVSSNPAARAVQLALLVAFALGMGRRIRWGRTVLFFAAVVAFNLATPAGRVLIAPAGFPVTSGALEVGVTKALGLTGLLLLSKGGIRRDLRLPGRAGRLLDLTLAYVRAFLESEVKLLSRDPVGRLDTLLRQVQHEVDALPDITPTRNSPLGVAILGVVLAASWVAALVKV